MTTDPSSPGGFPESTGTDPGGAPGGDPLSCFFVCGLDIREAGPERIESLGHAATMRGGFAAAVARAGLGPAVPLATCDRVVFFGLARAPEAIAACSDSLRRMVAMLTDHDPERLAPLWTLRRDEEAVTHLFAITASLESTIPGEPDVLGQVKEARREADAAGIVTPMLGRMFDAAFAAAKRVRRETRIGLRAVSLAAAAMQMAREVLGRFSSSRGLLLGTGEVGALIAGRLQEQGLGALDVADTVPARCEALAARIGARTITPAEGLADLSGYDIVLATLGRAAPEITRPKVAEALRARRFRPMILIDAAIPPAMEAGIATLDDAFLFTLDDLERIAQAGREERQQAIDAARRILAGEVAAWLVAEGGRRAGPLIAALRAAFETERARVLERHPSAEAALATHALIGRLLHGPISAMRASATGDGARLDAGLARLPQLFRPMDEGGEEAERAEENEDDRDGTGGSS